MSNLELVAQEFTCLVLGAAHYTKRVPLEKCREILEKFQKKIVLIGGPDESEMGSMLEAEFPNSVFSSCGKLSISQSAAVMDSSNLVLTGDTGMMHIAAALKKPILMLWGSTHRDLGMYPYYGDEQVPIIDSRVILSCNPCTKIGNSHCPRKHFDCMKRQDADFIIASITELDSR